MRVYQNHGVFAYAFLEGLSRAVDDQGLILVSRARRLPKDRVPEITKQRWGYEQFPMSELAGQTFPVARKHGKDQHAAAAFQPLRVFISYSHRDDVLRERLITVLSQLQRDGPIESWDDREITGVVLSASVRETI